MTSQQSHTGLLLAERYQLNDVLENGALCIVYRGQDTVLRRPIAVKAIPPEHAAAYREALHATAKLTHPAIVATYDAVESDDWLFFVQELVIARPLELYLRNGIPAERALDLSGQLARALAYAHSRGVAHGDLTPTAILIDRRATVRINNFALPPDVTYFTAVAGTLPEGDEQAEQTEDAAAPATPAGDVRAVGLLLWQMLSSPVAELADASPDEAVSRRQFRPDVPDEVCELVLRCVQPYHPRAIKDAEALTLALEMEGRALASDRPKISDQTPPALRAAREAVAQMAAWSVEETLGVMPSWNGPEHISAGHTRQADPFAASAPGQQQMRQSARLASIATETPAAPEIPAGQPRIRLPARPAEAPPSYRQPMHTAQTAQAPQWPASRATPQTPYASPANPASYANYANYADLPPKTRGAGLTMQLVLVIGLALFLIAFLAGFFLPSLFGGH